ncbi:MAG: tetratricopeptide repeat protein [Bacteroidota bacterium]
MRIFCAFILTLLFQQAMPQEGIKYIREGNKQYENQKYDEAEINYRKYIEANKGDYKGMYNLGASLYKQEKYDEAAKIFEDISGQPMSNEMLGRLYHNKGNAMLKQKKYEESIQAYKKSLKYNPADADTKYNLAWAQKHLKKEQQQKNQNQNQNKNQDNKDKNEKDKNKDKQKENENKDKQNSQKQDKQKMSRAEAEKMLEALNKQEKNLQEQLKKEKAKAVNVKIEKDW